MALLILAVIVFLVIAVVVQAALLFVSSKYIFKIQQATFATSIKIIIFDLLLGLGLAIVVALILHLTGTQSSSIGFIAGCVLGILIFHLLLKRYYKTGLLKNIAIWITQTVFGAIAGAIIAFVIILPFRMFALEPFVISGNSMSPNFSNGQYVLLTKLGHDYKRGDVIVFKYPKSPNQFFIHRVIGLPGETVEIHDTHVYINGQQLDESSYLNQDVATYDGNPATSNIPLKADEYYVLGDNRTASADSRIWGALEKGLIVGKYWITVNSLSKK